MPCGRQITLLTISKHLFKKYIQSTEKLIQTQNIVVCSSPLQNVQNIQSFSTSQSWLCKEEGKKKRRIRFRDPYNVVPPEVSVQYLKSDAYKNVYGDDTVWARYRRNFKGSIPPPVRKQCTRNGKYLIGNPCPICRDEYLTIHYENPELLLQFCEEGSYHIRPTYVTGICRNQQFSIMKHIHLAMDRGTLEAPVPFRTYNYVYYRKLVGLPYRPIHELGTIPEISSDEQNSEVEQTT